MYRNVALSIIGINGLIFLMQILFADVVIPYSVPGSALTIDVITYHFGLIPHLIIDKFYVWQLVSYLFLHNTAGFIHIFFNMYALFIFGMPIERLWGSKKFLAYYFICGIGAGIAILVIALISGGMAYYIPTIGASGAVFGLLLAFGILFPDVEILLFFIIPIKARTLVILYGGLELFLQFSGGVGSVSHIGHLGGLATGIIYFIIMRKHTIRYKTKEFVASQTKKDRIPNEQIVDTKEQELQKTIIQKLSAQGYSALTDDEVQYIRYKEIMVDTETVSCDSDIFTDEDCTDCRKRDACFVITVKKLMER